MLLTLKILGVTQGSVAPGSGSSGSGNPGSVGQCTSNLGSDNQGSGTQVSVNQSAACQGQDTTDNSIGNDRMTLKNLVTYVSDSQCMKLEIPSILLSQPLKPFFNGMV